MRDSQKRPVRTEQLLEALADAVSARAPWVVLAALALVLASGAYAARVLRVHVDTVSMFDTQLPHLQRWFAFADTHALLAEPLVVVVDAPAGHALRAAARLADAMRERPDVFSTVSAPATETFFLEHGLLYRDVDELVALLERLAAAQPLLAALDRDPTLAGLLGALERMVEQRHRVPPDEAREIQRLAGAIQREVGAAAHGDGVAGPSALAEVLGGAFTDSSRRGLVLALPTAGHDGINPARAAIDAVVEAAESLGLEEEAGYRVRVTGDLALSADELTLLNENAVVTGIVSFVLVTGILAIGLRNLRLVAVLCLTLLAGLALTAGFAAAAVGRLNMISVAFAVMSIGLGIDFGIHLGVRYRELAERGFTRRAALRAAVAETGSSLLLCSLTTGIAFYAFLPTDFSGLAEFGLISGTGIVLSLAVTLVLLPALVAWVEPRFHLRRPASCGRLERVFALPARRPAAVLVVAGALTGVGLATLPALQFSGDPLDLRVPDSDSASAFRDLLAEGDASTWNLQVIGRTPRQARRLARELEGLDTVARATTLADLVPRDQDEKRALLEDLSLLLGPAGSGRRAEVSSTPEQRLFAVRSFADALACDGDAADAALFGICALRGSLRGMLASQPDPAARDALLARLERRLVDPIGEQLAMLLQALHAEPVTLASLPRSVTALWVAPDGSWRVEVAPSGPLDSDTELAAFVDSVSKVAPDVTGSAVNVREADRLVVESLRIAFGLASVAIALLLAALWRSARDVALALAPIAMAALWILGAVTLLGASLNFANVIVLPLILGIGIDGGVHMVERHRRRGTHVGLLRSGTTRAILLSSCTTVASFGSLAFSPHPGMASMGRLLAIGIGLTLVANLLVLPALLSLQSARRDRTAGAGSPTLASAGSDALR